MGCGDSGGRGSQKQETHLQTWSISAVANLQIIAVVKAISAPTENERTVMGMAEYIIEIANIVSIVFVTYGIFVLHKWKKVADKLDALMEEMKDD